MVQLKIHHVSYQIDVILQHIFIALAQSDRIYHIILLKVAGALDLKVKTSFLVTFPRKIKHMSKMSSFL